MRITRNYTLLDLELIRDQLADKEQELFDNLGLSAFDSPYYIAILAKLDSIERVISQCMN